MSRHSCQRPRGPPTYSASRSDLHNCATQASSGYTHCLDPSRPSPEEHSSSSREPEFSPTGLLGDHYETLRQQAHDRLRKTKNRDSEDPFTGGLLLDYEIRRRASLAHSSASGSVSSRSSGAGTNTTTNITSDANSLQSQALRRSNTRRASPEIGGNVAQSSPTTPMTAIPTSLLYITSPISERRPSWRDKAGRGVRAPPGRPLISMARNAGDEWHDHPVSPPARSYSTDSSVSKGSMRSRDGG